MIFKNKQKDIKIFSDEKVPTKRKVMIGLLALAVMGGGISGYMQHLNVSKSNVDKMNNTKTLSPAVMGHERD